MAAVIATMSGRRAPMASISVANTLVHPVEGGPIGSPVPGSNAGGLCICSASSFSAGGYPMPLRVTACTITGPPKPLACRSADSSARTSCPSTGPTYFRPRSLNIACGLTASLTPSLSACRPV